MNAHQRRKARRAGERPGKPPKAVRSPDPPKPRGRFDDPDTVYAIKARARQHLTPKRHWDGGL